MVKRIFILIFSISIVAYSQFADTADNISASNSLIKKNINDDNEKPVQYRRGIPLQEGYQSYDEKYSGENLEEIKRSLFPLESTGVWTELNPKVPRVDYLGIHFVNKDTGWAVGNLGTIIKTTDGGKNWKTINTQTTTPILKVRSYSGQIVIASGYDGLILRSTDGGESFAQVTSGVGANYDLWGLEIVNDTLGWACGATALLKTTDGGENWQRINTPGYSGNLWWIEFMNESYGFIAADGKVLKTTDGGSNWNIIQAGDNAALYGIDIIDSLHIAAAGYGGTNYPAKNIYSSDGGTTWINGGFLTTREVNCIEYISVDTGYLLQTYYGLHKTTNRGENWIHLTGDIGDYELTLPVQNIGYNAGTGLRIHKAEGNLDDWKELIINDNFNDVFFVNERVGYAIGSLLYKTTDYGISWKRVTSIGGGVTIYFLDSLTGFLGDNTIYKTTDGGESWYLVNGLTGGVIKIFFINQTTGWATSGRNIIKTTDGGENWVVQITLPADNFSSIYFIDSLNGWATSRYIWKTTNGGTSWIQRPSLPTDLHKDIYFANIDTGWSSTGNIFAPSFFKTINGGTTWTAINEIIGATKFYRFPDPNHWMIKGSAYTTYFINKTYHTYDGGNTFIDASDDITTGFNSFSAVTNWLGYAVGGGGLILRYDDTTYVPVELVSLDGKYEGDKILLAWVTASELNNKGFCIEKSADGTNWQSIGFVQGTGTTTHANHYVFSDKNINSLKIFYRLKQIDYNGQYSYSSVIEVNVVSELLSYVLYQNFPNPFNPKTTVKYTIPKTDFVNISLHTILGDKIADLVNEVKEKGSYSIELTVNNLSSGIYFYRMTTGGGYTSTKKLTIIK